jgi:hypothetical protein
MRTVAIHQPEYLPWLGLLDKIKRADVLVLLDDVQFNRSSLQHRAKIAKPGGGWQWLTIPFIHRYPQLIKDLEAAERAWPWDHMGRLDACYQHAPAYDLVRPRMEAFFGVVSPREPQADGFAGLNMRSAISATMTLLSSVFHCGAPDVVSSSDLHVEGAKSERVLNICKHLGATHYLCGATAAREYLDHAAFAAAGIEVVVQQFTPPKYREGQPDVPCLSALDAWMHLGDGAKELLK